MTRSAALALALLTTTAVATTAAAAPGAADLEAAATQTAQALGGVLRGCPASFAQIGSPEKQCVGAGAGVEAARLKLSAALPDGFYGVWRSRDGQRSVYNWLKTAGGYVYLRLQPDPEGRAQTLAYLDLPPAQPVTGQTGTGQTGTGQQSGPNETTPADATRIGNVTLTPAIPAGDSPAPSSPAEAAPLTQPAGTAPTPQPAPTPPDTTTTAASTAEAAPAPAPGSTPDPAPIPFGRTLKVQDNRLNGPDVRAVQDRLIALMRPQRAGQGDGWYGPVTAQTVRAFQRANGLPVTGVVDRATWNRLFSREAGAFDAPRTP